MSKTWQTSRLLIGKQPTSVSCSATRTLFWNASYLRKVRTHSAIAWIEAAERVRTQLLETLTMILRELRSCVNILQVLT
jgi:hypothetical protein